MLHGSELGDYSTGHDVTTHGALVHFGGAAGPLDQS